MLKNRTQYDHLIVTLYNLTVDPSGFEEFNLAWCEYVQSHSDGDLFTDEHSQQLAEHFIRAFHILEKLGRQKKHTSQLVSHLIDEREVPSVAITSDTSIVYSNIRAQNIFKNLKENSKLLKTSLNDLLHASSIDSLASGINKLYATHSPLPVLVLLPNRVPALLLLQQLLDDNTIIVDIAGSSWDSRVEQTLVSMYGLTNRECQVAAYLYQGFNSNEIAERKNRSIETVRKQVKSVLNKTQTHSQTKLMRLLTSLNFAQPNSKPTLWSNTQCSNSSFTLKDGRQLAYYDTGKKNTKPLIVLHGMLHDPELPEYMHQQLLAEGYRIIGVSRAWFGTSSPPSNKDNTLENNAHDLVELLDELELEQVTIVGCMSGAIHALITASLFPLRVKQVVNIAGMLPLTHDNQINYLPKRVGSLIRAAKYFPALLPLLIRTSIAIIDKGDIRQLFETVYQNSPIDYALLEDEEVLRRLSRGYQFASNHGHLAYTHEAIAVASNISEYIDKISAPVCFIHGDSDAINHTKSIIKFSKTLIDCRITLVHDAGHLMMYTTPKVVTQALLESLNK